MQMQTTIENKLVQAFQPARLLLENESHRHSVPKGSESHFNLILVSDVFVGKTTIQRQRSVYAALADEMSGGVHALTMKTLTTKEWDDQGGMVTNPAPPCRGGSK